MTLYRVLIASLLPLSFALGQSVVRQGTVSSLPSASGRSGVSYIVTDSSDGTCANGGGSQSVNCRSNGTTWVVQSTGGGITTQQAAAAAPVQSVAGRTGTVTLTHTDVTDFNASASSAAPVQSVAGRTGTVTLTHSDVTDFNSAASSASPVQTVNGLTGAVTLRKTCEIHIWGDGTSGALQTSDSETKSCYNDTGATLTVSAVRCLADNSSTTTTVTPIVTGGASTSILTGALTCGNGTFASGTLNGTPTLTSGGSLDANITAAGTAKSIRVVVTF